MRHDFAPECLDIERFPLQVLADDSHDPDHHRREYDCEGRELPADDHHRDEIDGDQDRILYEHLYRSRNRRLDFLHVSAHPGYDVALPFLGEETDRQGKDLVIDFFSDVLDNACPDRDHHSGGTEVACGLESGGENQEQAEDQKDAWLSVSSDGTFQTMVHCRISHVLERHRPDLIPRGEGIRPVRHPEQDSQHRHDHGEREDVENGRQNVQDY